MSKIEIFEVGEKVVTKSEGTVMTVKDDLEKGYLCYWTDEAGNHQESTFAAKLLTKFVETNLGEDDVFIG